MADVLRERAISLELTQRDLAERTGLSQPRISRVFAHGVALTFEVALRLCDALDLSLQDAYDRAVRRTSS
jgi:plasmid maintenance system antidote protein VapI